MIFAENIPKANHAVLEVMSLGGWWTLAELSARTRLSEATVSARIRDNRTKYGYGYHKRRKVAHVREYQLDF